MTPVETAITDVCRWIDSIDAEKDGHIRRLARTTTSAIERRFIGARLDVIEAERARAFVSLRALEALRFQPECSFRHRPRMAKASLSKHVAQKRA